MTAPRRAARIGAAEGRRGVIREDEALGWSMMSDRMMLQVEECAAARRAGRATGRCVGYLTCEISFAVEAPAAA